MFPAEARWNDATRIEKDSASTSRRFSFPLQTKESIERKPVGRSRKPSLAMGAIDHCILAFL